MASGGCAQQASIRARSQPRGRNPSIIEPAKVVSRFMAVVGGRRYAGKRDDARATDDDGRAAGPALTGEGRRPALSDLCAFRNRLRPIADFDHDFANQGARTLEGVVFQEAFGGHGGLQGEGSADDRLELALLDPSNHVGGASALLLRGGIE